MALNARKVKSQAKGPKQEPMDEGTYPARVVQVIDFGVQEQRAYKGAPKPPAQTIYQTYEFLDEFCKDENGDDLEDKPRWLSEQFPLFSLEADLAKSTKRYYALDPDEKYGGDFLLLAGEPCMVTINQYESKGEIKNGVSSVAAMRPKEAAKAPQLVNPPKVFVIDAPDLEVFKSLPDWMQEKIKESLEFEGSALDEALNGDKPAPKAKAKPDRKAPVEKPEEPEVEEEEEDDIPW
ncbi:Phage protein [Pseudomonas phage GP100]|nr:Phage protein [Pseudomonas phage GP100]